jgi:putative serine protease PepD
LIVALVAGLIGGGLGAGLTYAFGGGGQTHTVVNSLVGTSAQGSSATGATGSVEQVASLVLPSVVSIRVRTSGGVGEGSGIIISSDGLILTNNHVVSDAAGGGGVAVTFNDGTSKQASVVGTDPTSDLAVIKVPGVTDLKPAALGRSADLVVGQPVVAIGSPLGLSGTVTSGIVSALNRPVSTGPSAPSPNQQNTVLNAIQTDAAINPGNSGGPLVNMQGQVVGINSAIATNGSSITGQAGSIGVGFAIPIDEARPIADQLVSSGKADHPLLGVRVKDALGLLGVVPEGAAIVDITSGGAADKAGLRVGDIITKLNDRTIDTADALVAAVRAEKVGAVVKITYLRNGATETTSLTLGSQGG